MAKALEDRGGVEVSVETGLGFVVRVDEPKGRNAAVLIQAEHLDLPVSSWCDTANLTLYNRVLTACAEGRRIGYTVVVMRKPDQPKDIPLAEVPNLRRIRDLEALDYVAGQGPAPELSTVATPDAPPANTAGTGVEPQAAAEAARHPSAQPAPPTAVDGAPVCTMCTAPLTDGSPVRRVDGELRHVECPTGAPAPAAEPSVVDEPAAAAPAAEPSPGDPPATDPPAERRPQPKITEGRPWEFTNSDGSLNPGSYAYQAAEGIVLLAQEQLLERARRAEGPFVAPSLGQIRGLAKRLLRASDLAQQHVRADGHVARMAASHARARAAIRASLSVHPVPWGAGNDAQEAWVQALSGHAAGLLAITVDLIDLPEGRP